MIGRVILGWLALSGSFLLGWILGLRLHLRECDPEKVALGRALYQAHQKIDRLEHDQERDWT